MECAWQVEIDPYCQRVLAKHWPDVERYGDVRECGAGNLKAVDVICGGFPCQPHSVAGKRKGKADDRDLWPEYRRIVAELRPRWVVGENVPGIVTTMLDEVLSDLEGEGYAVTTLVVPACAFDAPHKRDRVFIVAHAAGDIRGAPGDAGREPPDGPGAAVGESGGKRLEGQRICGPTGNGCHWSVEPNMGRVADGVPARVDRLRALGNAVVPQVAEWIGRRIVEVTIEAG
jgi:DNA (cytosine-5)-methyltransferase 1